MNKRQLTPALLIDLALRNGGYFNRQNVELQSLEQGLVNLVFDEDGDSDQVLFNLYTNYFSHASTDFAHLSCNGFEMYLMRCILFID